MPEKNTNEKKLGERGSLVGSKQGNVPSKSVTVDTEGRARGGQREAPGRQGSGNRSSSDKR